MESNMNKKTVIATPTQVHNLSAITLLHSSNTTIINLALVALNNPIAYIPYMKTSCWLAGESVDAHILQPAIDLFFSEAFLIFVRLMCCNYVPASFWLTNRKRRNIHQSLLVKGSHFQKDCDKKYTNLIAWMKSKIVAVTVLYTPTTTYTLFVTPKMSRLVGVPSWIVVPSFFDDMDLKRIKLLLVRYLVQTMLFKWLTQVQVLSPPISKASDYMLIVLIAACLKGFLMSTGRADL